MRWRPDPEPRLRGRDAEGQELERLVARARSGASGSLVLRGEAGVGKSALLDHVRGQASGCRIVRAAGIESEMELPFAGLHQLCAPFLDRLDRLPAPQRTALATAFGMAIGAAPDRFLVGLAVLTLLSDVAEAQPLVCLLDDAQWLDQASSQVLGFVARRLGAESVVMIFAVRQHGEDGHLAGLPELLVRPLDDADARDLLESVTPGRLDRSVRDRIVAEARGNPLALLELPRAWTPAAFAGGFGLPEGTSVSGRIEESFRRRLSPLPADSRHLLLVAAAEPVGDPVLMWAAATRLGIPAAAAGPATASGLLDLGAQSRFRHPLVRSVVYRDADHDERRMVHAALADVTDASLDPDRRAWHLAAAASGPDEAVATELEQSAVRAQARGGLAAAAAFLQRAVVLTGDPARRADRALAATQASLGAGAFDVARGSLAAAEAGPLEAFDRARVGLLRAEIAFAQNRGGDAPRLLLQAAKGLEAHDVRLARNTYLDAWSAALFAGHLARDGNLLDVSRAVAMAPDPVGPPLPSDVLLDGLALIFTDGRAAATPILQQAVAAFDGPDVSVQEVLRWGWLATRAANFLWDYERCIGVGIHAVRLARDAGALEVLGAAANALGQAAAFGGDFPNALQSVAEVDSVKAATRTRIPPHAAIALAGIRGLEPQAAELIDGIIGDATAAGQGAAVQYARWAQAVLMNGLGRYEEAQAAAQDASDQTPELYIATWALSELAEAAARTGDIEALQRAVARLGEHTIGSESDWALGLLARARALAGEGETADGLYLEAIGRLERTELRPELARSRLLYGEWLRRENRRVDARGQLRAAHGLLVTIGMEAFAERARRELQATGEIVRKRSVETIDELTAQELQIARLAIDGGTNAEIGAQLFLSPRTIEWHLRNLFAKLGVASRRELRDALPAARLPEAV